MDDNMVFPSPRRCPFDPPDGYRGATRERPLTRVTPPTGGTAWPATALGHGVQGAATPPVGWGPR
jgi:hypothetical protein